MPEHRRHFWAKTNDGEIGASFKSVAHHLLDVGAVAYRLLQENPGRLNREAALTGLSPKIHATLCALLAALHDLGKISRVFQSNRIDLWPAAVLGPHPENSRKRFRHWQATAALLNAKQVINALAPIFGAELHPQMIAAVAGHHGVSPAADFIDDPWEQKSRDEEIGVECVDAAAALCGQLVDLFPELRDIGEIAEPATFSFALNGLITLADWVGSDSEFFAFVDPDIPVAEYWPHAQLIAGKALAGKGLLPATGVTELSSLRIAAHAGPLRPMQEVAVALPVAREPQILLIEDGTGSGKTEAALFLAQRMMAVSLGEGLFMAMPTMATANAMYGRLKKAMAGLFDGPASLVLAHGKARIASALDRLDCRVSSGNGEPSVYSYFNDWIADSRKKAFFADAGAGSIDQAFLTVLPKKHLTLRQYALAGRILIVDEAHACDAYMGEELKTLIEMQARLGGSVIVLSATLGRKMRQELVVAFARGRGLTTSRFAHLACSIRSEDYPLLTRWSANSGAEEIAVKGDQALARSVGVRRIASRTEAVAQAAEAAKRGAAVCIICNAVDTAIAVWRDLVAAGHDPERCRLFHARFIVDDRLAIEDKVQRQFGRDSSAEARAGHILVATQVVEQSLDVDFDAMISDLAPADLLVQRAGRLWRHQRDVRPLDAPVLHVLSPEPGDAVEANWLNETLGPAAYVYRLPGMMWRTARTLLDKGRLDTPDDLRSLIARVYADGPDDLPEALRDGHLAALGKQFGEKALGNHNTIEPDAGYRVLTGLSPDEEIGTRLGEKSLTIRLGRREGNRLIPLNQREGASEGLNWALNEISVRVAWWRRSRSGNMPEPADADLVERTRAAWPEWERHIALFEVDGGGRLLFSDGELIEYNSRFIPDIHKIAV